MIMSHLFNCCDEEDGQAELRDDFSNRELRYDCNPPTELFPNCSERAKAEAISAEIRGRWTTSEIPAAANASAPISSADAVASRIGKSGAVSCSAVARSSVELAGAR